MRRTSTFLMAVLQIMLVCSCSNPEQQARTLVAEANRFLQLAQALPPTLNRQTSEQRLALLTQAQSRLNRLHAQFPSSNASNSIREGEVLASGTSEKELLAFHIPLAMKALNTFKDPLSTAQALSEKISDLSKREQILLRIARTQVDTGRSDEARSLMEVLARLTHERADDIAHARLSSILALMQLELGDRERALALAFSALSAAKRVELPDERKETLIRAAEVYYVLGVPERAMEALQSLGSRSTRTEALDDLAQILIARNLYDQAVHASDLLLKPESKISYLLELAASVEASHKLDDAAVIMQRIRAILADMPARSRSARILVDLAGYFRRAGEFPAAAELALEALANPTRTDAGNLQAQARALGELALSGGISEMQKHVSRVRDAIRKIGDPPARERALLALSIALIHGKQRSDADRIMQEIRTPLIKALALTEAAAALLEENQQESAALSYLAEAEVQASGIEEIDQRTAILLSIRDQLLAASALDRVQAINQKLTADSRTWRKHLRASVERLLESEKFDQALQIAREFEDPYVKAVALADIAKAQASSRQVNSAVTLLEEAISLIQSGPNPQRNLALISYMIDALNEVGWPKLAEDLLRAHDIADRPIWLARTAKAYVKTGQREAALSVIEEALLGISGSAAQETLAQETMAQLLIEIGEVYAILGTAPSTKGQDVLEHVVQRFAL